MLLYEILWAVVVTNGDSQVVHYNDILISGKLHSSTFISTLIIKTPYYYIAIELRYLLASPTVNHRHAQPFFPTTNRRRRRPLQARLKQKVHLPEYLENIDWSL